MNTRRSVLFAAALALVLAPMQLSAEHPGEKRPSQWQHVQQQVGLSTVSMEYSRPGVKGRVIWGELVPYDEIWRAGANERTVISFDRDVTINGEPLAAGDYGLLIWPTEHEWTFIFSKNYMSHGAGDYDAANDALRVTAKPTDAEFEEWLRYEFTDLSDTGATVNLHWEKLRCGFRVELAGGKHS